MTLIMKLQNFQQESGMSLMTKIIQNMIKKMKILQALNLKQKFLNQIFVIIEMHIFL